MTTFAILKNKFINFWESKGAKEIPGVSLVPQGDSTLLFVNSGMFPLVPYLSGQPHPLGTKLCNVQRCLRTEDLEDMGDTRHLTLFHMIGNWSLGDFFKKEQIPWVLDLYVNHFGLDVNRIYVSVFEGDESAPRDNESIDLWKQEFRKFGIDAEYSEYPYSVSETLSGKAKYRIFSYPKKKNWWCRGEVKGEPGGPDTEIFYDMGADCEEYEEKLHVNGDNGRFVEIGNNVFMQYMYDGSTWNEMEKKNVDFGGGLDRIVMCKEGKGDLFLSSLYNEVLEKIVELSKKNYSDNKKQFRIIADHIKASVFLLADGVLPSNKDQGYILRRLIRRMIVQARILGITENFVGNLADIMISLNGDQDQIVANRDLIITEIEKEENKFRQTLEMGMKEFENILGQNISGKDLFYLYESFGFPIEQSIELLQQRNISTNIESLREEFESAKLAHSELSRSNSEAKFKGGLADNSEIVIALHTSHHLLLAAVQKVLGSKDIHQRGSNITSERLRMDFNFDRKLTSEELVTIESQVQNWIDESLEVTRLEMPIEEAEKLGAEHEFGAKYPEVVSVYQIGDISLEFCGGPHVANTSDISAFGKFKILKEEASSAGIRRIKAGLVK